MRYRVLDHRTGLLSLGLIMGLTVSYLWPHEPAQAVSNSRADKFEMFTAQAAALGNQAIFVLDHLTGKLRGAVLDPQSAKFTTFYYRDVAADFGNLPGEPQFAVVSATTQLQNRPGMRAQVAPGIIFVGELNSGQVLSYSFPWQRSPRVKPPIQLMPVDKFAFRDAAVE